MVVEVVAALIWNENKFLICQRPANKDRALLWEFVGGKVEARETKQQALIRECREELAITVSVGDVFMDVVHAYPDITVHLTLLHAAIIEGTPQKLEHNDSRWITVEEIPQYKFCPADEVILEKLQGRYAFKELFTKEKNMEHPLVEMACKSFYCKSHIQAPLISANASTIGDKGLKEKADRLVRNINEYPHAFLLACLMDSGVEADVAWTIPYKIQEEVGSFKIQELYKISESDYSIIFNGKKKLHRYPKIKAKVFSDAIRKIVESDFLNGDASKIWSGKPSSSIVIQRLLDFNGCGFKIANMAPNLLFRYFGVEFSDYSFIDIAPDVHTMRVFQRLGLTPYCADTEISRIYTIAKARELNPEFPGIVDGLVWEVGREYCSPRNPKCSMCKFNSFCMKNINPKAEIWN